MSQATNSFMPVILNPIKGPGSSQNVPPSFQRRLFTPLSNRIVLAMVVVAFLSAIFAGTIYQLQASSAVDRVADQAAENYRRATLTRLQNSRLPDRVKEQVEESLQLRKPFATGRAIVSLALDQAIWIVAIVAIGAAGLAFGVGWFLTRRIVGPLEKLRLASQQVAGGDFSQRVPVANDDEIGQVAYSFNLMANQLEGVERRRRELLSDVAHELKTPLASIQGHIEALRDNLPRAKANPQAIYEIVLEDVSELDRMIGSLRAWLNAQSLLEQLEPRPLKVAEELTGWLQRFQPRAATAHIKLDMQLDKQVKGVLADRNALRHMVSNLLDNALRYTPAGGQVRVMAWAGEGEQPGQAASNKLTIAVADTGCGIAPEHWPHLFERFYRVDKSRSRDTGGTGLGLALVRDLALAQGGKVWLNSQIGKGTIFFVTLPAVL